MSVRHGMAKRETRQGLADISAESEYEHILEEMADTLIMIWQIKYLLGVGEGELSKIIERKLDRQIERIKGDRNA